MIEELQYRVKNIIMVCWTMLKKNISLNSVSQKVQYIPLTILFFNHALLSTCFQLCYSNISTLLREHDTENHTEKPRVTLKIERTKGMSNAGNFQCDYKGFTFLDNNSRQITVR